MGGDPSVKLVLDCHTDLGESPVWDARTGRLYFVDINEKHIHVYTPQDKNHFVIDAPVSSRTCSHFSSKVSVYL
jgi:sugar lactone lactonase YvrE